MRDVILDDADSEVLRAGERMVFHRTIAYKLDGGPILLEGDRADAGKEVLYEAARQQLASYGNIAFRAQAAQYRGASSVELAVFEDALAGTLERYKDTLRVAAEIAFQQMDD